MGAEDYKNPLTRLIFRRAQNSPGMRRRMMRHLGRRIVRQQALLDRLLARVERGHLDARVPSLS